MTPRERRRALSEIVGADPLAMVEAAKRLARDPTTAPELRALLRRERRVETRHAIVHALSWHDDLGSWPILIRLLADCGEDPMVRGQAAEGLAYKFHRKRRGTAAFELALRTLVTALDDPSPDVRYYAAFASGAAEDRRMLPKLRRMLKDHATSPTFIGTVGQEAQASIDQIEERSKKRSSVPGDQRERGEPGDRVPIDARRIGMLSW